MDMENERTLPRNKHLMSRDDSAMLVVDAQEKLLNVVPNGQRIAWNIRWLAHGANVLDIPVVATEQYPEKLGPTDGTILSHVQNGVAAKMAFSCCGSNDFADKLKHLQVYKVLVVGIETHVCVMQTCFDLMTAGYDVYVAVDAIGARFDVDHDTALRRMEANGVVLSTTETALFEWCEVAGGPKFKEISSIVRETEPTD